MNKRLFCVSGALLPKAYAPLYIAGSLNRSSYYKWLRRDESERTAKDAELIERICQLYQGSNGIFGYRRMQLNLKRRFGLLCNKKRVYRAMQANGMKSVYLKRFNDYLSLKDAIEQYTAFYNSNRYQENLGGLLRWNIEKCCWRHSR